MEKDLAVLVDSIEYELTMCPGSQKKTTMSWGASGTEVLVT